MLQKGKDMCIYVYAYACMCVNKHIYMLYKCIFLCVCIYTYIRFCNQGDTHIFLEIYAWKIN